MPIDRLRNRKKFDLYNFLSYNLTMRKKFGKLKILMICFSSSLLIWILIAVFSIYQNQKINKKVSVFTQLSTKPPVDRLNRIYFAITKSNNWSEANDMNLFSYEAILANTTDRYLKDWCIKLKVPDDTSVENTWDCTAYIEDNYLYIRAEEIANEKINSKSETHFGFLLISENDLNFRSAVIATRLCKRLSSNYLHHPYYTRLPYHGFHFFYCFPLRLCTSKNHQ